MSANQYASIMAGPAPRRVDQSTVYYTNYTHRNSNFHLVLYNVSIPASAVDNAAQRLNNLVAIRNLLVEDFGPNFQILYQVTAAYSLIHSETGERYEWTGSFQTNFENNPGQIQGFQFFNANTFVNLNNELLDHAEEILRANGQNSKWTFETLRAVIFNFQIKVPSDHGILGIRNIDPARQKRIFSSFNLL